MGQLGLSLRSYEEERKDLEAKLAQAGHAAKDSPSSSAQGKERGQEHAVKNRMESDMMRQTGKAVEGARQQAEAILAEGKGAIDKMFDSIAGEAKQVLTKAETDAAKHKAKIEEESAKLLSDSRSEAERLRGEAEAAKKEAVAIKEAAVSEAAEVRAEAEREAAATVEQARIEHDKLATRIPELRAALTQFEAQVRALAAVPAIDLNEVEAAEASEPTANVEVTIADAEAVAEVAVAEEAVSDEAPAIADSIPVPDGSGNLPAARDLVDLGEYRELRATPAVEEVLEAPAATASVAEPATPPVSDGAPLERLASTHVASRAIPTDNETIYQRRGGGLRRRINAKGDE